jgi:hypothetical protein
MAVGDGTLWNEAVPTDASLGVDIDDYIREDMVATRRRMANEHVWPSSQTAITEAGQHTFLTLQAQAAKPTVSGSQIGAVYADNSTPSRLKFEDSAGTVFDISQSVVPSGGIIMWHGSIATIPTGWYLCDGNNSTPNLTNRFIVGADADAGGVAKSTVTGSALQSSDTGVSPAHTHTFGSDGQTSDIGNNAGYPRLQTVNSTTFTTSSSGTGTKVIAVFYALAYIMKS